MTLEEILELLKANPELRKGIVTFVADTEEGKQLLDNYAKVKVKEEVDKTTSSIYKSLDDDTFEITGERKKHDQKTFSKLKELMLELVELRKSKEGGNKEEVSKLKKEIEELKSSGDLNQHFKQLYEKGQEEWKKSIEEKDKKIAEKEEENRVSLIIADLNKGKGLNFKEDIPKEAIEAVMSSYEKELAENAKIIDGKVVYHDKDGKIIMNKSYKEMSSKEIWEDKMSQFVETSGQKGGAAEKGSAKIVKEGTGDDARERIVLNKSMFSTKTEFYDVVSKELSRKGYIAESKEFNEIADAAYKEYGVSELPIE